MRLSILLAFIGLTILSSCSNDGNAPDPFIVGIVNPVSMGEPVVAAFKAGLADLGYVAGENIQYLYEGAISDADQRTNWVQTLVEAEVDLIVGITTPGAVSAKQGTRDIPIIFFPVTDPVGSGLVDSLQVPGGNATGVASGNPHPLRLQLLLQLDPTIQTVYAPYDADSQPAIVTVPSLLEAAEKLGLEMNLLPVQTDDEIAQAIAHVPEEADAIFVLPDPRVANHWRDWSQAAIERGIPFSTLSYEEVEGGALMAYGEELKVVSQQAARMASVVLHGTPTAGLPVETADFFLSLNLETARKMGLVIPESILQRATYVIYPPEDQ